MHVGKFIKYVSSIPFLRSSKVRDCFAIRDFADYMIDTYYYVAKDTDFPLHIASLFFNILQPQVFIHDLMHHPNIYQFLENIHSSLGNKNNISN